ncbi:MAG TPA: c-type cytochrome [Polyangiaceae bacterium]|nr:c-type cytochrome [Polyangiaceae bacterium]
MSQAWKYVTAASFLLVLTGVCGCKSKSSEPARPKTAATPAPPPEPVEPDPAADARQIFRVRCSVCHGQEGRGDGPGGAALTPKPRVFTDSVWQDATKDEQLRQIIVKGGAAVGKSPGMPGNPDLEQKPDVVGELVKIVRGFKT